MVVNKSRFRVFSSLALYLFKLTDVLFVGLFGVVAYFVSHLRFAENSPPASMIVIAELLFFVISRKLDLYRPCRGRSLGSEIGLLAVVNFDATVAFYFVGALVNPSSFATAERTIWVFLWGALIFGAQTTSRIVVRYFLKSLRAKGINGRRILLVGTHRTAGEVARSLDEHLEYGLKVVGYVDDRERQRGEQLDVRRLGPSTDIQSVVEQHRIDQIWITFPVNGERRASQILDRTKYATTSVRFVIDLGMIKNNEKSVTEFLGIPLLDVDVSPMDGTVSRLVKNLEDRVIAFIALALLSPLLVVLAIGVKLSSPGPVLYRQTRISWNNHPFTILKFRSMPVDVEKETGAKWARPGDRRATRFGTFLRKTSLDELPQFINVLKGDMSIVGPRPERPELIEGFKEEIPDYMKKHMVKAGITGWAQVNGYRGDTDLAKRIEHDLYYIKNWSPFFDLSIAWKTVLKGFINKNAY